MYGMETSNREIKKSHLKPLTYFLYNAVAKKMLKLEILVLFASSLFTAEHKPLSLQLWERVCWFWGGGGVVGLFF